MIVSEPAKSVRADWASPSPRTPATWQNTLKNAVRDPVELCRTVGLGPEFEAPARRASQLFPVFAPRPFLTKVYPGDPHDPLLRQILPLAEELASPADFSADPVGDLAAQRTPGLLQKYTGRVLLVTMGACAVNCRYCFRRHFPYDETPRGVEAWQPALDQIASDKSIHEVILSGGDPLTLVDETLAELAQRIAAIRQIRRLRVHTRLPIMIPERVTGSLLAWLCGTRLTPIVVVHANHPRELDEPVAAALARLVDAGVPVLNQSVLLAGVNDDAAILAQLCERLVDLRVIPYYLHQLDRVQGAAHFEVPRWRGLAIMEELRAILPGYAVPRYVEETAGGEGKEIITSEHFPRGLDSTCEF